MKQTSLLLCLPILALFAVASYGGVGVLIYMLEFAQSRFFTPFTPDKSPFALLVFPSLALFAAGWLGGLVLATNHPRGVWRGIRDAGGRSFAVADALAAAGHLFFLAAAVLYARSAGASEYWYGLCAAGAWCYALGLGCLAWRNRAA